ncbi:hypothetical protein FPRO06_13541 [Fusarium proliferatum]|nr:hypothetical protein FPRO06_13541 [Fusarium proliferatum]
MVHDEPGTAPIEPCTASGMENTIMDIDLKAQNEADDTVTLVNNCYASTTWRTRLQPEDSAAYSCSNQSLYVRGTIVRDLLLDHKPNDRDKFSLDYGESRDDMRSRARKGRVFGRPLRTFLAFSPGGYDGKPPRNLSALDEHMNHWIEVEMTTWGQAEASEEVAQALRNLWSIAICFTMNFHLSPDRDIFQLDRLSLWRRIIDYIRDDSKATSAKTELLYKPGLRAQSPETLQDLGDELTAAITNLDRHNGTAQLEPQASRDNENKNMLRNIQSLGGNLFLACLLRMCTISTPTRFSITSQDITDMFSVRISRLEWLIRDSASQPQVYQISAVSDELRILKEILQSQMRIFEALQRKSQQRHRQLTYDIEKLQDATEGLKSRAALYIKIKAEDQSVAIYLFTLVTVVFLLLSFATSYMGMNTSDIRDMEQGQWVF